jgi:hypothetical protein
MLIVKRSFIVVFPCMHIEYFDWSYPPITFYLLFTLKKTNLTGSIIPFSYVYMMYFDHIYFFHHPSFHRPSSHYFPPQNGVHTLFYSDVIHFFMSRFCVWEKMWYLPFWVWHILLNITSRSIHFPENGIISFFFKCGWIILYYIYIQHFLNLFIICWAPGLIPWLGYYAIILMGVQVSIACSLTLLWVSAQE